MTKHSINQKLVCGKGINDYDGSVTEMINGKKKIKPFYAAWSDMIARCYSEKRQKRQHTYVGCSVCQEWLSLVNFKKWFDENYIDGFHLDKDIIKLGNKIYAPEYCRYVSRDINNLLIDNSTQRGKYPQGVSLIDRATPYKATVSYGGSLIHIGVFHTIKAAFKAYANAKHKVIIEAARVQTDIALREGLVNHAKALLNQAEAYD